MGIGGQVTLTGHIDVPPDRRDAIHAALPEHIRLTRAEPGCLSFDVTESTDQPGRLVVHEVFDSPQSFETHQQRTGGSDWARVSADLARHYVITGMPE